MATKTMQLLSSGVKKFAIVLVTIAIWLGIPILLIVPVPIYLIRKLVFYLSKFVRPDLGKMLSALSSTFATDDLTTNPKLSIVFHAPMKKCIDIEQLKLKMVEKIIGVRKVGRDLKNIELKQYPCKWMGFFFWKWDEDFDIANHVQYLEDVTTNRESKISQERLNEIKDQFLLKPYHAKRSPWDVTIVRNVEGENGEDETVMIFRMHHSLGDGFSSLKLIGLEIMDEVPRESVLKTMYPKISVLQKCLYYLKFVTLPYELAECVVESYGQDEWRIPEKKRSKNYFVVTSERVSMDVIKDVKNAVDSSVTVLVFAAITAALRQSMLKKKGKVPHHISMGLPFPMKGHPDKLRNYCSGLLIKLPVGEKDPLRRLKKIEATWERFTTSTVPLAGFLFPIGVGCMFHWMIRPLSTCTLYSIMTVVGSSFPGPKTKLTFLGEDILDVHFALGPNFGNYGITFTTLTYNNDFKVRFMVNENILSEKTAVEEMVKDVLQEFHILKKCANSNV